MPSIETTHNEIYRTLLKELRQIGAEPLAQEIERTVSRGIVSAEGEIGTSHRSTLYRPMENKDALAVGLEFLLTALDVPAMHNEVRLVVGGDSIESRSDRPDMEHEETPPFLFHQVDQETLRNLISRITKIAQELHINLPEIA